MSLGNLKVGEGVRDYFRVICADGRCSFDCNNIAFALEHFEKPWSDPRKAVRVFHVHERYSIEEVTRGWRIQEEGDG